MTTVTREVHFAVRGHRKRAVLGPPPGPEQPRGRVPRVARLMALAIRFERLLDEGVVANQSELARLAHVTQPRMTQIMNLLHLAPDIQEQILFLPEVAEGRDPVTERDLRPIAAAASWKRQRAVWRDWNHQFCPELVPGGDACPGRSNHIRGFDRSDLARSRSSRRNPKS